MEIKLERIDGVDIATLNGEINGQTIAQSSLLWAFVEPADSPSRRDVCQVATLWQTASLRDCVSAFV